VTRSLVDIVRLFLNAGWRRRYLICVPVLLMLPLSVLGSRFAPNTYEARTILLLQETGKENPFLKDFVVGLHVKERISALKTLVKSEHVLLNVLKDIRTPEETADPRTTAIEMRKLAGAITVELIGTDLLELRLRGDQPKGMGRTLDAIKRRFLERLLSPERSTLGATRAFLADQLADRKAALEASEREMADFRIRYADKLPALYSSSVQRLATLQQQLQERTMQLAAARAGFETVKQQMASANPIVGRLEESIVQVTTELAALRARYTEEHSQVQAAERKLGRLHTERQAYLDVSRAIEVADIDQLWSMAAATVGDAQKAPPLLVSQVLRLQEAKAKQATLEQDVRSLTQSVEELQKTIADFAPIEQLQAQLEKRIAIARELYQSFVERHDKASTSYALGQFEEPERIKVIDAPQDPTIPITLPKIIFVVLGIVAGLVLGVGLAVVAELLDPRLRTREQFQRLTGLPVLAHLPRPRLAV
jgi:polysaccharide chain length determinant protein (PEP-CTERM system associated)